MAVATVKYDNFKNTNPMKIVKKLILNLILYLSIVLIAVGGALVIDSWKSSCFNIQMRPKSTISKTIIRFDPTSTLSGDIIRSRLPTNPTKAGTSCTVQITH